MKRKKTIILTSVPEKKNSGVVLRWNSKKNRIGRLSFKKHNGMYFGVPLEESFETASEMGHMHFALLCITFIELHGIDTEGVFRISGSMTIVQEWKNTIDSGLPVIIPDETSIHDTCEILKLYFRQLPERLIPEKYIYQFNSSDTEEDILTKSVTILEELSTPHKVIFLKLLGLLYRISQNQAVNKMTVHNLSTCFSLIVFKEPNNVEGENAFLALEMTSTLQRVLSIMIENYTPIRKNVKLISKNTNQVLPFENKEKKKIII
jgi:hypothetical protein